MKLINGLEFTDKDIHCIVSKVLNANFYQHQKDGKFGFKNGANKNIEKLENFDNVNQNVIEDKENNMDIFGKSFDEFSGKPKEAIQKLMNEKQGYVPSAIYREEIGSIDFVYGEGGKKGYGLAHIVERHGERILQEIPEIIEKGIIDRRHEKLGRIYIDSNDRKSVIRLDWNGEKRNWLTTTFIVE